ncbi:MAG TPA: hypothetical protein VMU48_20545 [Terracidiphilus sp.]|nr:hypothetical protein [Terracidiphilus sp.]
MSDGPHRSLPMPPCWRRVAERCANVAFSTEEITNALIPALHQDCQSELSAEFIDGIRAVLDDQGSSLFKDDPRPRLEALREVAGCGIGVTLLDNVMELSPGGAAQLDDFAGAMAAALEDRAARRARQIEEHFYRKTTAPRALNTRTRLDQSIAASPLAALARQILKLDDKAPARQTVRMQGLDDGVRL